MTASEKAKELVEKFINDTWNETGHHLNTLAAKECAKITVNEILQYSIYQKNSAWAVHWNEVLTEIDKL